MSKRDKIVKGGAYLAGAKVVQQVVSFSVNAVLAILLNPEIYGIVALVTVFNGFISIFTNFGFGASVIQRKSVDDVQLSSLFWLDLFTSLVSFLVVFTVAPYAADIYKQPEITSLLRLISVNFILVSFFSLNRKMLEKKLEFSYLAGVDLSAAVVSSAAGIMLALSGFKAYSLIWQYIVMSAAYIVLIRIKNNWFAGFVFNWKSIRELVIFTLKYKGALTINYFERNVDFLLLGKLYAPSVVGLYSFAYNIMYMPVKRISNAFSDVLFPSFSSVNDDMGKLKQYFLKATNLTSIITFPLVTLLFFNVEFIVTFIFGEKWVGAIELIKILCFAGALLSVDFSLSILPSINKTELSIYAGIIRILLIVAGVFIGSLYGITGVAFGILIVKVLTTLINYSIIKYKIGILYKEFWGAFSKPIYTVLIISAISIFPGYQKFTSVYYKFGLLAAETLIAFTITFIINKTVLMSYYNTFRGRVK